MHRCEYLAYDLGPRGVRVNAVSAGPVRTLAGRAAGVEDMLPLYEKMSPLRRNITHEEVGRIGALLALRHVRRHHRRNPARRLRLQHHGLAGPIARWNSEKLRRKLTRRRGDAEESAGSVGSDARPSQQIAVAVVEHDGRFLVGLRPAGKPLAGFSEFPGGKVHSGETPAEAAERECREETGLSVVVGASISDRRARLSARPIDAALLSLHAGRADREMRFPSNRSAGSDAKN